MNTGNQVYIDTYKYLHMDIPEGKVETERGPSAPKGALLKTPHQ